MAGRGLLTGLEGGVEAVGPQLDVALRVVLLQVAVEDGRLRSPMPWLANMSASVGMRAGDDDVMVAAMGHGPGPHCGTITRILAIVLVGCGATEAAPVLVEPVAVEPTPVVEWAPVPVEPAPAVVKPALAVVAATGTSECDPLPIRCARTIASRTEEGRTIVYITEETMSGARPGQWVHCVHDDRGPSPPCEVIASVSSGVLEASCGCAPSCGR